MTSANTELEKVEAAGDVDPGIPQNLDEPETPVQEEVTPEPKKKVSDNREKAVSISGHAGELPPDILSGDDSGEEGETKSEAPATPEAPKQVSFEDLPEKFLMPDGKGGMREISREDLAEVLPNLDNVKGWQKAFTERDQKLKEFQNQLQQGWAWQVEQRIQQDPSFRQKMEAAWLGTEIENPAASPAKNEFPLKFEIPDDLKDDVAVQAFVKANNERLVPYLSGLETRFQDALAQKDQALQDAFSRLKNMEVEIGKKHLEQRMQTMEEHAKRMGIVADQDFKQRVLDAALKYNIPPYDENPDYPSAFRFVAASFLEKRISNNGVPPKKPQKVLPTRGSSQASVEPLSADEEKYFRMYQKESGGKATLAQFRRDIERYNRGR